MVAEGAPSVNSRANCGQVGFATGSTAGGSGRTTPAPNVSAVCRSRAMLAPLSGWTHNPTMSSPLIDSRLDPLAARCADACATLIEERWRSQPGLALRIQCGEPGVVERPGRTRFDLQWSPQTRCFSGPVRARAPWLPLADGALALVVLDCLAIRDDETLVPLLAEVARVLADDGRVLVLDIDPWGWPGLRRRIRGHASAPGATRMAASLRRAGLEDIEIDRALCLPTRLHALLQARMPGLERGRWWPLPGGVYGVSARKRSSNVIAIPFARDGRPALVAAPEGMRRAG